MLAALGNVNLSHLLDRQAGKLIHVGCRPSLRTRK
jgi:hypothetical protein